MPLAADTRLGPHELAVTVHSEGAAQSAYEIAAYGTARAIAEQMNRNGIVKLLSETLKEKNADELLTKVAKPLYIDAQAKETVKIELVDGLVRRGRPPKSASVPAEAPPSKKRGKISAAARKKMAALMKKRWAAARKAGKKRIG